MKRKRIALSASLSGEYVKVNEDYLDAIWNSGGVPTVLLPRTDREYIQAVTEEFDGFVFCGGCDIDPKYYGEEINGSENICSVRDEFEKALFEAVYKTGKPILGICRGEQVINVFLGGSLCQHVDNHVQSAPRRERTHKVRLCSDGFLKEILSEEEIEVNSFHHQIVSRLADGLLADAVCESDGYVEAYHHKDHKFLLGVQWHPECYHRESETSSKIFEAFVDACGK